MNEMVLSANLKQLMRVHENLSVSDLARETRIPQPTLHHILSGATKKPRKQLLDTLANFFSVSTDQLLTKGNLPNIIPETVKENLKISTVPIIKWEHLKNWPKDIKGCKEILLDRKVSQNSFAVSIEDNTLEPNFPNGSLLIFDFTSDYTDRDFVIAHMSDSDSILFNRVFIDELDRYLKHNTQDGDVQLIKISPFKDRVIGKLIEVRIQY